MKFCRESLPCMLLMFLMFFLVCGGGWCADANGVYSLRGSVFTVSCPVPELFHVEIRSPENSQIITSAEVSTAMRRPIADIHLTCRAKPRFRISFDFRPLSLDAPVRAVVPYRAYVLRDGRTIPENIGASPSGAEIDALGFYWGKVDGLGRTVSFSVDEQTSVVHGGMYGAVYHLFADIEQSDYEAATAGRYTGSIVVELSPY